MADYNSGLPIRTEADGADERVHVKVVDGTTPSQRMTVDTDGNAHVEIHGNDPAAVDQVIRTSELGAITPDGVYDVANNTVPGNVGVIASSRNASPSDTTQTQRVTAVTNSTVRALDVSLHDDTGAPFTALNPLYVNNVGVVGSPINDYATSASVAAGATVTHDYTVTLLKVLSLDQIECSASGKLKVVVAIETGIATGVFTTKWVQFNSTATPNTSLNLRELITIAAGVRVRVSLTNKDNQGQDVYSTISGHEL